MFSMLNINIAEAIEMAARMPTFAFGPNPTAMNGYRSRQRSHFDPRVNRHTGNPHEHKREIARNLRRAQRSA